MTEMAGKITEGIKRHVLSLARDDGGFDASPQKGCRGMADSLYSDFAAAVYAAEIALMLGFDTPDPEKTAEYVQARQTPEGNFRPIEDYGLDENAQKGLAIYNTCMGIRGLKTLGKSPARDPRPFLERIIREEFKPGVFAPPYAPCMVANSYTALGEKMPGDCEDRLADFLLGRQDKETGWFLQPGLAEAGYPFERSNPFTFHAVRFFHLVGREIPMADKMADTFLRVQEDDGSWKKGYVHGTFDAIVALRILGGDSKKYRDAARKGALWALTCRRDDKGFNHFGDDKPSELDACYFHSATLVMAGMIPTAQTSENRWAGWGHTLLKNAGGGK